MSTRPHTARRTSRLELELWYVESLQPKLARAADGGLIEPAAAAHLERQLVPLFDPGRGGDLGEAA